MGKEQQQRKPSKHEEGSHYGQAVRGFMSMTNSNPLVVVGLVPLPSNFALLLLLGVYWCRH